jgi:acetylornithine deacetylase/succinyl-diaminopimelate desuccinylase-like protein
MSMQARAAALALLLIPAGAAGPPAAGAAGAVPLAEAAGWLRGYLRIDTSNPPGGEAAAAAYLARILHREGIPTQTLVAADGRASLYARLEGTAEGDGLLLLHHLDVVPPGPGWTAPPFDGLLRDGELWGRGALDVKSLGVAHLAAFVELRRRGVRPARDVAFLAVADEESGGGLGIAWLWQHHPELFAGIGAVLGEGGINLAPRGEVLWWGVETAQKRPLWLRVTAHGRAGHGSGFNPESAMHRLIAGLGRVLALPPQWRVTAAARTFFGALAPHEGPPHGERFANLDAWVTPEGPQGGMLPGQANFFLDTVQVTVVEGSDRINVVPGEVSAQLDVRLLPDTDADAFLERLRGALGPGFEVEVLVSAPPSPPSPKDTRAYAAVSSVLGREGPVVPAFIAGFTDARFFRERGIPTYGVSPFILWGEVLRGIHGPDERIPLRAFERGVLRMRRIVETFAYDR